MSDRGDVKQGILVSANSLLQTNLASTVIGTPNYLSPEIWQERAYVQKVTCGPLVVFCQMSETVYAARSTVDDECHHKRTAYTSARALQRHAKSLGCVHNKAKTAR